KKPRPGFQRILQMFPAVSPPVPPATKLSVKCMMPSNFTLKVCALRVRASQRLVLRLRIATLRFDQAPKRFKQVLDPPSLCFGAARHKHLYNHAARNGTTFFFLMRAISLF